MCGIAGLVQLDGSTPDEWILDRMHRVMAHRGPDGVGRYLDGPVGLAHRRLSIIDLSDAAAQPMANEDDNVLLIYNGEIYNFPELRTELESAGHVFRSRTDSEVLIHGYEEWGDEVVARANGMFAFALWDRRRQRLILARDRYGVKPLYWYASGGVLIFASEIKSILEHPSVRRDISYPALNEYFSFQNVLSDLTLFDGIRLLPPATILTVGVGQPVETRTYWDYPFDAEPLQISEEEAATETHRLFVQAVNRQLVSDVPVGAYLSGGMDSGSIASVAGTHLDRLRTFTAGFDLSSASGLELEIGEVSAFDQFRSVFDRYGRDIDDREGYVSASLYFELKTFLPGLLIVEDKLSMAHSLETRVPFLDDDLVNFAVRLPVRHKVGSLDSVPSVDENVAGKRQRFDLETSEGKAVLRRALAQIIPPEVTSRTKQGFSAPDASWFRGESIDYINRILRGRDARIYEFLRRDYVLAMLDEHTSGS